MENLMSVAIFKKIAVVTGASSGIGAVYADRLAARGYDLILVARRADRLEALSKKISKTYAGANVEVIAADLAKESDLVRIEKVLATNPAVRILVNNAGLARLAPIAQAPVQQSLAQIALNIISVTRLTHAVLPALLSRNDGVIVNIASVLAIHSLPVSSVYSGTKAFVLNFSRGLQDELVGTGVKVQVVLPASTATEIWDASGLPLSALDQDTVMSAENLVDAALAGLDKGEAITWPTVADASLWDKYDAARSTLFAATQTNKPAARYNAV
jgi:short-subunit dehydrogenase